jgi:mannose-6-phosphate isomerase-like protein (cupin superfamily)
MELVDLEAGLRFDPGEHVQSFLVETPLSAISVVGWEPGQAGKIHCHPGADEIYHVLSGEGIFTDGREELRLGAGATVVFAAGEVHRVESLTRMVLYRVQAGADRAPSFFDRWPG